MGNNATWRHTSFMLAAVDMLSSRESFLKTLQVCCELHCAAVHPYLAGWTLKWFGLVASRSNQPAHLDAAVVSTPTLQVGEDGESWQRQSPCIHKAPQLLVQPCLRGCCAVFVTAGLV